MARAAIASALVPALLLGAGAPAVAATNTLTVTTLDRNGKKVTVTTTVVNLATNERRSVKSNKAKKLPKGTYALLASIRTGDTSTLGARTVKVSGASKTTVDARKGKRVSLGLSPAIDTAGREILTNGQICTRSASATYSVDGWDPGGGLYVVPNSSKRLAFAAMRSWVDHTGVSPHYAVMYTTTSVPSTPTRTFRQSSLATVDVETRRGPSAANYSSLGVQPIDRSCGSDMYAGLVSTDQPYRTKIRLSAGKWDVGVHAYTEAKDGTAPVVGHYFVPRTVSAGKSYTLRFFRSAWGPSTRLPQVNHGWLSYVLNDMFADPGFPRDSVEGGDKATATLKFGGKTVKTKKDRGWESEMTSLEYKVKKSGWYTLTNDASRYYPEITFPAGMLSPKTSVTYRFKAKPNSSMTAPVYALTMLPTGLDLYNRAKAGANTNVQLKLSRPKAGPDAKLGKNPKVKTVTAKASFDGGKTWRSVSVKKVNGVWTAQVGNPTSGAVSLRARVTDTVGGYTDVTIIRAYAIS
ncbi:hypothetical protein [Micromonospora craniellae]|uniref:Uncharacterized protein n=1 Tax=Micromonospora craniellae TaxID=2294034 RepID=A0A372FVJ4_9ACTN|nr:hypothetical protein [Micromonospora craniellae]QOC89788.1 hypothetical protein ID554_16175 [Micromonospora craniellae]RFS44489.1 hypothetical protein D0Q02_22135 [Micromonospora craniellae]